MRKNRIAVILLSIILIVAEINQMCFAFPSVLDDVPEKQILITETSLGKFSDYSISRAFGLLNYLDIISEDEKDFEEDAVITRGYAVSAIASIFAGSRASGSAETFSDVPVNHTYSAGIYQALEFGILDNSDSKFYPNKNVSYEDVSVWALKAMNFDFTLTNKQPLAVAEDMGIFKGVNRFGNTITKGQFMRILENILNTDLVDMNLSGSNMSYSVNGTKTYISNKYNVRLQSGILTGYKYSSIYGDANLEYDEVLINNVTYKIDQELSVDDVGYSVSAYVDAGNDNRIITLWKNEGRNNTYVIEKKDDPVAEPSSIRYANSKKINLSGARVMVNNLFNSYYSGTFPASVDADKIVIIDNDGDGRGDLIKLYEYTHYYVKSVSVIGEGLVLGNDTGTRDISDSAITEFTFEGKIIDPFADLKVNDVLTVLEGTRVDNKRVFCAEISRDVIEGTITMIGTDNVGRYYVIDGVQYYLAKKMVEYMTSAQNVGDHVNAYISIDKKIVDIKSEDDFVIGYLMEAKYRRKEDALEITVYTVGGEVEKLTSAEKIRVFNQANQTGTKMLVQDAYNECLNVDGSLKDTAVGYTVDSEGKLRQLVFEVPEASVSTGISYPLILNMDFNPDGKEGSRAYHGLFAKKWTFDSTTPVITIPENETMRTDAKAYSKTTGNKWGNGDGSYLKEGEIIKAYNSDKFLRPEFYTIKSPVATTISQSSGNVHFCVIDKICDVYDEEEGCIVKVIGYYQDKQYKETKISDIVTIARPDVFCDVTAVDDLRRGDVLQIHTDAVGSIDVFTVYFRISDPPAAGFGLYFYDSDVKSLDYSKDINMNQLSVVYARVVDIDSNKALLTTNDGNGGKEFPVTIGGYSSYGNPYYLIYDRRTRTATPAALSDINPNDIVVMRKYYNHVQDVIILKN